jgi:hypothetical protein
MMMMTAMKMTQLFLDFEALAEAGSTKGSSKVGGGGEGEGRPSSRKARHEQAAQESSQPATTGAKSGGPAPTKKVQFFESALNDLSLSEGVEACLCCSVYQKWISHPDAPKFFVWSHDDFALTRGDEFVTCPEAPESQIVYFKTEGDDFQATFHPQTGKVKLLIQDTVPADTGTYKVVGINDKGEYDETSGTLEVLRKFRVPGCFGCVSLALVWRLWCHDASRVTRVT